MSDAADIHPLGVNPVFVVGSTSLFLDGCWLFAFFKSPGRELKKDNTYRCISFVIHACRGCIAYSVRDKTIPPRVFFGGSRVVADRFIHTLERDLEDEEDVVRGFMLTTRRFRLRCCSAATSCAARSACWARACACCRTRQSSRSSASFIMLICSSVVSPGAAMMASGEEQSSSITAKEDGDDGVDGKKRSSSDR